MEVSTRHELNATIETLTHSGESALNQDLLRKVKRMCRTSDSNLTATYEIVMSHLSKDHAEIRLSSFQLIDDLFIRSHLFRELLISDFQLFTKLVTGVDADQPLPPPKPVSEQLKEKSLLAIRNWNEKFGDGYPKLRLGYNYLKFNKKVNFEELVAQSQAAQRQQQEREARRTVMLEQRIQEIKQEITDLQPDILDCLMQTESCFNLLLPRFDLPDIYFPTTCTDQLPQESGIAVSNINSYSTRERSMSSTSFASVSSNDTQEESAIVKKPGSYESESPCLASIYGTTTSTTGGKDGKVVFSTVRGKGKLTSDNNCNEHEDVNEEVYHSSDSEVEWEDVEPSTQVEGVLKEMPEQLLELQHHGFASHNFSIPVELTSQFKVIENEDNSNILATLRESKQMLTCVFLPTVLKWMEWLTKAGEEDKLRNVIDLKSKVKTTLDKFDRLNLIYKDSPPVSEDSQKGAITPKKEMVHKTHAEWTFGFSTSSNVPADLQHDPTTPEAQLALLKRKSSRNSSLKKSLLTSSASQKSTLHHNVPVVPFGMDLFHWENHSEMQLISTAQVGSLHRFWVEEHEIDVTEDEKQRLSCRTINYPGEYEPVKRACKAPLPSGKLCPRRDRHKCPFHGLIVPRDDNGKRIVHEASLSSECETHADTSAHIHDGTTLTGLKVGKKGKRVTPKEKKFPGLTDLKGHKDTARKRLTGKVLSKKSLKKVAKDIDATSSRKYQDKFAYNFNYALKS